MAENGILTSGGKHLKRDQISKILSNPFYVGLFRYGGETYEGKHEPAVSKKVFDQVQEVLTQRGKPKTKAKIEKAFTNLISCAECGRSITAEIQKGHTYYRCTKKNIKCSQPYVREEELDKQVSELLQKFSLKQNWAEQLMQMLSKEKLQAAQSTAAFVQEQRNYIQSINTKLQRLLDGYLEQVIEQEVYRTEKAKLLLEKKSLEEQTVRLEQKRSGWLEPFEEWIKQAQNIGNISAEGNLFEKKVAAKEIFGSNLTLSQKQLQESGRGGAGVAEKSGAIAPQSARIFPQMHWAALRAAHQMALKKTFSFVVVWLYSQARTYFSNSC